MGSFYATPCTTECLQTLDSPTEVIRWRIFTHKGSNYAQSRKEVPFWGLNDGRPHLGGQIPPKPARNRQKIGHSVREMDDNEE